jgi:hypothetical protein
MNSNLVVLHELHHIEKWASELPPSTSSFSPARTRPFYEAATEAGRPPRHQHLEPDEAWVGAGAG